jgi:hypothetical protein
LNILAQAPLHQVMAVVKRSLASLQCGLAKPEYALFDPYSLHGFADLAKDLKGLEIHHQLLCRFALFGIAGLIGCYCGN